MAYLLLKNILSIHWAYYPLSYSRTKIFFFNYGWTKQWSYSVMMNIHTYRHGLAVNSLA
jgi:hypothetical protein